MTIAAEPLPLDAFNLAYFLSLAAFTFSVSITPGPNNLMLTASGIRFGFWRSLPHLLGICVGFTSLCALVVMGLGQVFLAYPILQTTLKFAGATYLLYLAFKIIRSSGPKQRDGTDQPFSFIQAVLFQIVNPKAWTMAITGFSAFSLGGELVVASGIAVVAAFATVTPVCMVFWTMTGVQINRLIENQRYVKWINYTLGGLTAACVFVILQ